MEGKELLFGEGQGRGGRQAGGSLGELLPIGIIPTEADFLQLELERGQFTFFFTLFDEGVPVLQPQ